MSTAAGTRRLSPRAAAVANAFPLGIARRIAAAKRTLRCRDEQPGRPGDEDAQRQIESSRG
jgi:hypothetical protein